MTTNTPNELQHHGVKGMRWGVRKKYEPSDRKTTAAYKDAIRNQPKLSEEEQAGNLAANEAKWEAKFSKPTKKTGWRPTQDQVFLIGAGTLAAAAIGVSVYKAVQKSKSGKPPIPGQACSIDKFKSMVTQSKGRTWYGKGFMTENSLEREAFSLPKGHLFNRISTKAETEFFDATYATHSTNDFHRYLSVFRHEKSSKTLHHVTFTAEREIKVPSTKTALETMRSVLTDNLGYDSRLGYEAAPSDALRTYNGLSGSDWQAPSAKPFFDKLKAKGYSAIVDEMDAGVIGETPLVLFDYSKLTSKASSLISEETIKKAESSITELLNRK